MSNDTFQWTDELVNTVWHSWLRQTNKDVSFWEVMEAFKQSKMPKKEFQILEGKSEAGKPHYYMSKSAGGNSCETLGCKIYSVRRLSDDEVFTIGDTNEYPTGLQQPIKEFRVSEERPAMMLFRTDNEIWQNLTIAKKAQPKKERIEVERIQNLSKINSVNQPPSVVIDTNIKIPSDKYEAIKAAIENVLNDD